MHNKNFFFSGCLVLISMFLQAQGIGIGEWRDHLPYNNLIAIADGDTRIYAASGHAIMYVNKADKSIGRISKVQGLSDIGISTIAYDKQTQVLVIAYENSNIDILYNNKIYNLPDIKNKTILGKKSINNVTFIDKMAYLSCGFGIVVIDPVLRIFKDTYMIGPNSTSLDVTDITTDGTNLYVSTEKGIYSALKSHPFLADYHNWIKDNTVPQPNSRYNAIEYYKGHLIANLNISNSSVYNMDTVYRKTAGKWTYLDSSKLADYSSAIKIQESFGYLTIINQFYIGVFDTTFKLVNGIGSYNPGAMYPRGFIIENDKVWVADRYAGLSSSANGSTFTFYNVNGPITSNVYAMDIKDDKLWLVHGGRNDSWNNSWNIEGVSSFINESWISYKYSDRRFDSIYDLLSVAVDPFNSDKVYLGSWGIGVIEMNSGKITKIWNDSNSSLQSLTSYRNVRIGGMLFDKEGNLWISNVLVERPLSVKMKDGTWKSFNFAPVINAEKYPTTMAIDDIGQKWVVMARGGGLFVFNDNNTITNTTDDQFKLLNTQTGTGALPSSTVLAVAKDLNGAIWIGSDHGIAVVYEPENVFNGGDYDAQQIVVEQGGYTQNMLENEIVTSIVVDGANRKWIGTQTAGVFYLSADGTEQIHKFTTENSPLSSNTITFITINDKTGEVFIGTSMGVFSYKNDVIAAVEEFDEVYAYPNPVQHNYNGTVAIKGLVSDTYIKITDVSGRLVYTAKVDGGQAVWNTRNHNGDRVTPGVYLVFCTNMDGSKTMVAKLMVL